MSQRYRSIYDEAYAFYRKGRFHDAAVAYLQARHIAREGLMPDEAFSAGVWAAHSWEMAGYYIKAFDLLLDLLRDEPETANLHHRWVARKRVLDITKSVNPSLSNLQQRLDNLCQFYHENPTLPEADLYQLAGNILNGQGLWAEALEQYELAWAKQNDYGYVKWAKAREAALCNLRLGQVVAAQRWCDLLGQTETDFPESREDWFQLRSDIALYKGDWSAAQQHAIEAEAKSDLIQRNNQNVLAVYARATLLQPQNSDPCRPHHPAHFRLRQKPRFPLDVHDKYVRRLLVADFRLASVRYLVGISPIDDLWYQYPQQLPSTLLTGFSQSAFAVRQRFAWRAINRAMQQAQYLDNAYECHWRQDEVKQRQERLIEIIQFVEQ